MFDFGKLLNDREELYPFDERNADHACLLLQAPNYR
jgi:hypothetical protein